ncbi:hypothetical protein [Roseivirga sp.]|uniref:hypothetical protein n=1 Tax=Roseivirga sp. TaxID=1964215 RepID=UPI003B52CD82
MDIDVGTLVYIALAIIYFIVQSNSKNKKKQQKRAAEANDAEQETQRPSRRPTFEELLEEFTGQRQVQPVPAVETEEEPQVVQTESKPRLSSYEASQKRAAERKREAEEEAARIRARVNEQFDPYHPEEEEKGYSDMFSDLDSAKRAFIASEVFKRKYN